MQSHPAQDLFFIFVLFMFVRMCLQGPDEGVRSLGAGVAGICGLSDMGAGSELHSHRAMSALSHRVIHNQSFLNTLET